MKTLLNIIWLVLSGIWMAIGYALAGLVCFVLIITIPFGIASFRIAGYALWPFGRTVVQRPDAGAISAIGNIIWFFFFGIWLALGHIISGCFLCRTFATCTPGRPSGRPGLRRLPRLAFRPLSAA
ncbi:MAG: yccF [Pseudonocardiales bacterium]|nr:yccF [Pseudonocardiales bacterium]